MKIQSKEIFTISNLLSLVRLFIAIPLWILLTDYETNRNLIIIIGLFAALTDFLDGFLARKLNQITEFGKIIDPLADKIIVGAVVIKLFYVGLIPSYYFYLIIGRDIIIFLTGIYISNKLGKVLPSNMLGKITVFVIAIVLIMLIGGYNLSNTIFKLLYLASIILIFASFVAYGIRAIEFINQKKNEIS